MVEHTAPEDTTWTEDDERVWQTALWGSDLAWFNETGHCGHCGSPGAECTCSDTDPCGCREAHRPVR